MCETCGCRDEEQEKTEECGTEEKKKQQACETEKTEASCAETEKQPRCDQ